jgi:hypothetical protein
MFALLTHLDCDSPRKQWNELEEKRRLQAAILEDCNDRMSKMEKDYKNLEDSSVRKQQSAIEQTKYLQDQLTALGETNEELLNQLEDAQVRIRQQELFSQTNASEALSPGRMITVDDYITGRSHAREENDDDADYASSFTTKTSPSSTSSSGCQKQTLKKDLAGTGYDEDSDSNSFVGDTLPASPKSKKRGRAAADESNAICDPTNGLEKPFLMKGTSGAAVGETLPVLEKSDPNKRQKLDNKGNMQKTEPHQAVPLKQQQRKKAAADEKTAASSGNRLEFVPSDYEFKFAVGESHPPHAKAVTEERNSEF